MCRLLWFPVVAAWSLTCILNRLRWLARKPCCKNLSSPVNWSTQSISCWMTLRHKKTPRQITLAFWHLVGTTRFELVTSTMSTWRSNQLSYAPKEAAIIRGRSLASTQSPFKTIYWIDLACLNLRRKKNPPYGGFNKPKHHQWATKGSYTEYGFIPRTQFGMTLM